MDDDVISIGRKPESNPKPEPETEMNFEEVMKKNAKRKTNEAEERAKKNRNLVRWIGLYRPKPPR